MKHHKSDPMGRKSGNQNWRAVLFGAAFFAAWALNAFFWKKPSVWILAAIGVCVAIALISSRSWLFRLLALAALIFPGLNKANRLREKLAGRSDTSAIRALVDSEELILSLSPKMGELSSSVLNLQLPDASRRSLFAESVATNPLSSDLQPPADDVDSKVEKLKMWDPLFLDVRFFDHAHFSIVKGFFALDDKRKFISTISFEGLARTRDDAWRSYHGKIDVHWLNAAGNSEEENWRIVRWHTKSMSSATIEQKLFIEALEESLPKSRDLENLRHSEHQAATIAYYRGGKTKLPHPFFAPISANQKPGISIADIDGDGDDDIYVSVRIGRNKLLENQGDGTFVENALMHGLDVEGHCTSALFADFDNDGDSDLMLGRSLRETIYMENNRGFYSKVPQRTGLPTLAISLSATDFNGDGLLDVYVSTYRPAVLGGSSPAGGVTANSSRWPEQFLRPEVAVEYRKRHAIKNAKPDGQLFPSILDQIGPPNVLLVNRGGGAFEEVKVNEAFGVWRNTLQSTWCDYDEDGDQDLYVANDWAPDSLFRNDGEAGFTDVTQSAATTALGFAMGASWGDYDNDGRHDLYVSNMFSKAGQRITAQVDDLEPGYAESAAGNWLYRQTSPEKFELMSGNDANSIPVAKAGWSWGGQFADFNNDGWLDLYVVNGYFTAPREVATEMDL